MYIEPNCQAYNNIFKVGNFPKRLSTKTYIRKILLLQFFFFCILTSVVDPVSY